MPPRPTAIRRRPGVVAGERRQGTPAADGRSDFLRPNLPALQGTPSSRRQYGYGADAEPSPMRPRGHDNVIDLGFAVKDALDRHEQQKASHIAQQQRQQEELDLFLAEANRDETNEQQQARRAADQQSMPPPSFTPLPANTSRHVNFASLVEERDESDTDDARSFGLESEYYGDATIASTPGTAPANKLLKRPSAPAQKRVFESQHLKAPELPSTAASASANAENEQPSSPNSQDTPGLRSNPRRPKHTKPNGTTHDVQQLSKQALTATNEDAGPKQRRTTKSATSKSNAERRAPLRQRTGNSFQGNGEPVEETIAPTSHRPSIFARARNMAASASPFSARRYDASDHSEMDDAMQRDIQDNADESETEDRQPQEWQQRWSWTKPLQSITFLRRDAPLLDEDESEDEPELEDHDTINWWQLLNPYTYFQALGWIVGAACASVLELFHKTLSTKLMEGIVSSLEILLYFVAGVIGLITVISLAKAAISGGVDGDFNMSRLLTMPEIRWAEITDIADKVHNFVPELSWPTWSRSSSLPDLSHLDNDGLARLDEYLKLYQQEFERIQQAGKLHDSALRKLEAIVPKLVHTELQDGKPVVSQEFWHALRDLIHRDGDFLTFEKKGGAYEVASEAHWKAIASRINKDAALTKQINVTVESMEQRIKVGVAGFWDSWVKSNDAKITEMLGSALDQIQSAGSQREFDKRLRRIVQEHIDKNNEASSVVSRDEFLRHLGNEFATHRAEVRAELAELQPQLDKLVRQAAGFAGKETPQSMSKAEIITLVHGMVNKAIADINLEAMARGQIHSHWDTVLRHQINYFGVGAGATIDAKHISATFQPPADSAYVKQKGLRGIQLSIPRVALEPWTDEGDCWCAARSENRRGNPHGAILAVQLGHRIVPQHIVIEHIVAAATTDPDARPKEIEVYADIDGDLRDIVRAFSATHFPDIYPLGDGNGSDDDGGWNVSPAQFAERFVKIAQFVYEDIQPHDGVQVHRLSDELLNLGVATDHVIVRAVSNYGAKTHTCFYRVRLYGQRLDDGDIAS